MYDVGSWEGVAGGYFGGASVTASQSAAFGKE